jgi:hypothetical protein
LFDPVKAPILEHSRMLRAGKHLDWLALRILAAAGPLAALAYVALPLGLLFAGIGRLRSVLRSGAAAPAAVVPVAPRPATGEALGHTEVP